MKNYIILYIALIALSIVTPACDDDFLNLQPLDSFSEDGFFTSSSDLKSYVNAFYDNNMLLRTMGNNRVLNLENGTDNLVSSGPAGRINTRGVSGAAPGSIGWDGHYGFIRRANYLLENTYKVPRDVLSRQYTGEAFFTRAVVYFDLLSTYGGVPIITKSLNIGSDELYKPRDERDVVASQIIKDLDSAIVNLSWKSDAGVGRINKEAALLLKTRVGLFEGSWEYYHGKKGTPFAVEGKDGSGFLQEAVEAGELLIDHQGSNIYQGSLVDLFQQKDYSGISGAFFYRVFSQAASLTHNVYGNYNEGTGLGITKQLVDAFLMSDGLPSEISSMTYDESSLRSLGQNKDPRLSQTIWARPVDLEGNTVRFYDAFDVANDQTGGSQHAYRSSYPGLIQNQQRQPSPTGYRPWKGVLFDVTEWRNGETSDLIMRYAEALLNFAEARAILGEITQDDLDKSVNVIRQRAGMPEMNLATINSWPVTYSTKDGFDPDASNILNEIRRERRVELALEGFRWDDIRRWAALDEVFNGFKPLGAHAAEFISYWNDENGIIEQEGFQWVGLNDVKLLEGNNFGLDETGNYFNPFFNNADFGNSGDGGFVAPERDYLSPIGTQEIEIYQSKGGVTLEQNPGWF
ncbi:RagB/SusD family nutrient uptake outer membrane protein [Echinicola sp. 20G]|uniref:RagB/SusD family nutrient uptake outer membrane protein n=1 Tax=Echinicola sp. 20G TaxID=2781961 RepID=UPI001910BE5A|nr:RagB/SusD family nutrient uptake outer membrane protein [Echinicola sp. 20G]